MTFSDARVQAVANKPVVENTTRWPMQGGLQSITNTSSVKPQSVNAVPVTIKVEATVPAREVSQNKTPSPKKETAAPGKENIPATTAQSVE